MIHKIPNLLLAAATIISIAATVAFFYFKPFKLTQRNFQLLPQLSSATKEPSTVESLFNQNKFSELNSLLDAQLSSTPDNVELLLQKAQALAQEASLTFREKELGDEARKFAQQALGLDPSNVAALTLIGYTYEIQQNYVKAHEYFDRSLAIEPNNADTLSQKAHAYLLQGETAKASSLYKRAADLDPRSIQALSGMARIAVIDGDIARARHLFEQIGDTADNGRRKAESYYSAAVLHERDRTVPVAKMGELVQKAVTADPAYAPAHVANSKLLYAQAIATENPDQRAQLIQQSFGAVEHALKLDPNLAIAHLQLAVQLKLFQQPANARAILLRLLAIVDADISLTKDEKAELKRIIKTLLEEV